MSVRAAREVLDGRGDALRVRIGRLLSAYAVVAAVSGSVLYVSLGLAGQMLREWVVHNAVGGVAIGVLVWLIVRRQPRNAAVWALIVAAVFQGTDALGRGLAQWQLARLGLPTDVSALVPAELPLATALTLQVSTWTWIPGMFALMSLALLLFPDGRLPSRRWRWVAWWSIASIVFTSLVFVWVARPSGEVPAYADPAIDQMATTVVAAIGGGITAVLAGVVASVVALVRRYRASTGVERQQFRWIAWGASVLALAFPLLLAGLTVPRFGLDPVRIVTAVALPVFIGSYVVAVARYRLYEIDRVISRTVSYGLVVAVLGGAYVTAVIALGAAVSALTGQEGSDLAVAASVLAVVALFRPVRTRVQTAVDRRFNRTTYEARLAVEAFAQGLRDEVNLEAIRRELATTATVAVQPSHVSVWLADGGLVSAARSAGEGGP